MNRMIRRLFQWVLVVTLTTILSASPVSAGWLLHHMHCQQQAACCYVEPLPCVPICPPPVCSPAPAPIDCCGSSSYSEPVVSSNVNVDGGCPCGCGETNAPMIGGQYDGTIIQAAPAIETFESSPPLDTWQPDNSGIVIQPNTDQPIESSSDVPPVEPTADPSIDAAAPELDEEPAEEPAPSDLEAPSEDPFAAPAVEAPAAEAPATEEPATEEPATEEPAEEAPMDDLFGDPPAEEEAPAENEPVEESSIDDLFGVNSPAEAPPEPAEVTPQQPVGEETANDIFAESAAGESATESTDNSADQLDDLFGTDPAAEAAPAEKEAAPATEQEVPASEPATEPETDSIDDLFGAAPVDAAAADDAPAEVTDDSIEELFGESPSENETVEEPESTVESNSIDDLFGGSPKEESASEKADTNEPPVSIEDLFGAAPATGRTRVETIEELPAPQVVATDIATKVKVVAVESKTVDPLSSTHVRTWIDNSGSFSTEGRLIEINRSNVRLIKSNGRTCTVPKSRLSEADAAYVDSIRRQLDDSPLVAMAGH